MPALPGWTRCEIDRNLRTETSSLAAYCLGTWTATVDDALLVAAAVEFCDRTVRRSVRVWGRTISLRIPVHESENWRRKEVGPILERLLKVLTGDQWQIKFLDRKTPARPPPSATFEIPDSSSVVIPFSDGLDSLAVSTLMERDYGSDLIRIRVGNLSRARNCVGTHAPQFAHVPYKVVFENRGAVEPSFRSRGFKFMLACAIAAFFSQTDTIVMTESGQGAIGPVLVPVGHYYEDVRSHPQFAGLMTSLVRALFNHRVEYRFPRLWHTKAETLAEANPLLADANSLVRTRSCWKDARHASVSGQLRQCGACASCMLRRMSMHSAGIVEEKESYVLEQLSRLQLSRRIGRKCKERGGKRCLPSGCCCRCPTPRASRQTFPA